MDNSFFRELNDQEVEQFKQWARDNFKPDMEINETWHPVVRQELARLQKEQEDQDTEDALYDYDLGQYDDIQGQYDDDPSPYDGTYSEE
jgi:hypothetical protein